MKGWMAMAGVAVASVGLTAAVMAGGMHHAGMHHGTMHAQMGGGEGLDWFVMGALDDLDVTAAQRAQVLAVKDRMAAGFTRTHDGHAAMHAALFREWQTDKMDTAQLNQLVDAKVEELRGTLHQVVDGVAEIHDTLTPEQRRRLTEHVQEMHGEMHGHP